MRGVFKMTNKPKELTEILAELEQASMQDLWEQSSKNPDPDKRKVFDALFTYVLGKRQTELINRKKFVI